MGYNIVSIIIYILYSHCSIDVEYYIKLYEYNHN